MGRNYEHIYAKCYLLVFLYLLNSFYINNNYLPFLFYFFFLANSNITGDLGYPEQKRHIEQTEALEKSYQQHKNQEYESVAPESVAPPQFKTPIKDQQNIKEGGFAHFEARLEPLGDSTLQVEWLKDGKPVEASTYKLIVTFFFTHCIVIILFLRF